MACDINGSGCKVCPGIWIAGILFLVMTLQGLFFRTPTPPKSSFTDSAKQTELSSDRSTSQD